MARPLKVGIDYFPTDVDIDQDDKVVMVKNKYGLMGMGTVTMLLARIYKTGYYYNWTEREQELFAGHYGSEVNVINNVVNECIKWGFFDKGMFDNHHVLTSMGIQKRYLLAVGRRKDAHINEDYWLLGKQVNENVNSVNVRNNSINVNDNIVNASKSTQSKVNRNKTKVKEIKKEYIDYVFLTETEYKKLTELLGEYERESYFLRFASWISGKSEKERKSRSAYLTILNWNRDEVKKSNGSSVTARIGQSSRMDDLAAKRQRHTDIEIARNRWVSEGNEPDDFRYTY